jgi:transcriptional regulator with XRE-family HTH domain
MGDSSARANGSKIKAARDAKGWSQEKPASEAGYKVSVIQKLEQGTYFSLRCLECCAEALGVLVPDLLVSSDPGIPDASAEDRAGKSATPRPTGSPVREPLSELHALDDDGRVGELTRRCYYKIENATLTIRGTEADLIINVTMYDHPSRSKEFESSSHCLQGHGRFVDGSANILYTVEDQTGQLSWAGVCVLNVPPTGQIHGYWMAAGHTERGRTVLGRLELDRKFLVRKSSEEAGGHDQREG